jgi:hypothetical protein
MGDLVKAEKLARESFRIRTRLYGGDHAQGGLSVSLLAHILQAQRGIRKLSMTKYKEAVRIFTKLFGPDHPNTVEASSELSIVTRKLSET